MLFRIFMGVGLLALGYYVGREVGRAEPIREELRKAREENTRRESTSPPQPSPINGEGETQP